MTNLNGSYLRFSRPLFRKDLRKLLYFVKNTLLFMFLVLQLPPFHVPGFLAPCSVPRSVPRFPVV